VTSNDKGEPDSADNSMAVYVLQNTCAREQGSGYRKRLTAKIAGISEIAYQVILFRRHLVLFGKIIIY
jgi:hypothetical protein